MLSRYAAVVLALATCGCAVDHGVLAFSALSGGTGSIDVTDIGKSLSVESFDIGGPSPVVTGSLSLGFTFGGSGAFDAVRDIENRSSAGISCAIDWPRVVSGTPMPLQCTIDVTLVSADESVRELGATLEATLIVTTSLDGKGNGVVTTQLDAVADVIALEKDVPLEHALHVELRALTGSGTYEDEPADRGNGWVL